MSAPRPPAWTERILRALLSASDQEYLLGDLAEAHAERVESMGRAAADRAYRKDARGLVGARIANLFGHTLGDLRRQLRLVVRRLLRTPVFASATIATLALGLGGAAIIVALAQSILRPLPYPEPDRLVAVWETREGEQRWVAPANYLDWRRELSAFDGKLAAHLTRSASLTFDGTAYRSRIAVVSGNYFDVLGVDLLLGAGFDPTLDTAFPERHAVVSYRTWLDRFGGDRDVLGRTFLVEDQQYLVVGVAPDGLTAPEPGLAAWIRSRPEAPEIRFIQGDLPSLRDSWYFEVTGRMASGVTMARAATELSELAARLEQLYPDSNEGHGAMIVPLLDQTVGDFRPILASLGAAVLLLLLAAVVNVTHLASSRRAEKAGEAAIHVALGAGRAALVSPVVVEGAILGLAGAVFGAGLAGLALREGMPGFSTVIPRSAEVALGTGSIVLVLALGTLIGVGISLVAFAAAGGMRASSARLRGGERVGGWQGRGLMAAQVAAAIALLASAGLLGRSLWSLSQADLGFDTEQVATVWVAQPDAWLRGYAERVAEFEALRETVERLPEVHAAAISAQSPLTQGLQAGLRVEGWDRPDPPGSVSWAPVHPDYFAALGMSVVSGRGLERSDGPDGLQVAVVNEALVRSVFPNEDPVGRVVTIGLDAGHDRPLTIVGVVSDTRTQGPTAPAGPVLYRPIEQTDGFSAEAVMLTARFDRAEGRHLAEIREALRATRPGMPVYAEALGADLATSFQRTQSMLLAVVGVFAGATVLLGAVGVYGVAAHATRRRRREIGVRMALGADRLRVLRSILVSGLARAAWGIPLGIAATFVVGLGLESVLVGVDPLDPLTLAAVCAAVLLVTACALFFPAQAASRTDPAVATRAD